MTEQGYLEFPWSMEDTIENMKLIKEAEQERMRKIDLDGMGEKDAKEIGFDFDRAIKALEKQIPKKVVNVDDFADYAECPSCGAIATDHLGCLYGWCRKCGQKLKRSEEE